MTEYNCETYFPGGPDPDGGAEFSSVFGHPGNRGANQFGAQTLIFTMADAHRVIEEGRQNIRDGRAVLVQV
jgi:hypothetical protein